MQDGKRETGGMGMGMGGRHSKEGRTRAVRSLALPERRGERRAQAVGSGTWAEVPGCGGGRGTSRRGRGETGREPHTKRGPETGKKKRDGTSPERLRRYLGPLFRTASGARNRQGTGTELRVPERRLDRVTWPQVPLLPDWTRCTSVEGRQQLNAPERAAAVAKHSAAEQKRSRTRD